MSATCSCSSSSVFGHGRQFERIGCRRPPWPARAFGKISSAMYNWLVIRLPVRNWPRKPFLTSVAADSCPARLPGAGASLAEALAEAVGVQVHRHRHREAARLRIVVDADVGHLTEHDAAEIDRRAHRQPAQRLVEVHHDAQRHAVRFAHGVGFVRTEAERHVVRRLRADAAGPAATGTTGRRRTHGRERLRVQLEAARIEPQIDAARMPPARIGADVLVVRRGRRTPAWSRRCRPCRARSRPPGRPARAGR